MKKTIITLAAILIASLSFAQGGGFNYKALITDNGNVLANHSVTFKFTVLENGTTSVYQETQTPTTDTNGIVGVNVGEGILVSGNFSTIDWGNSPYFLKVEIDTGSGYQDFGTTEFKAVPYAKFAEKAGNAFSGNFGDLSNVPTGLSDGDNDTHLTDAQIAAMGYIKDPNDADHDASNELQNLSLSGTQLSISNGNNVNFTGWDTDASDDFSGNYNDLTHQPNVFSIEGTNDAATQTTDNIVHAGSMRIGGNFSSTGAVNERSLKVSRRFNNDYRSIGFVSEIGGTGSGMHYGLYNYLIDSGTGTQYGVYSVIHNTGNAFHYGNLSLLSGSGSGSHFGTFNQVSGTGTGEQYGVKSVINNTSNGNHYGNYSYLDGSGTGDHYGSYNYLSGDGTGTQFGIKNYIDNSGNSIHYGIYSNVLGNGSGPHYGISNKLEGTGAGDQYGTHNAIYNSGNGTHYGDFNQLSGTGTGEQYGVKSLINNTSNSIHYGNYSYLNGSGSGAHYGSSNFITGDGTGEQYGVDIFINNSGNANHYGSNSILRGSGSGWHLGSYNQLLGTGTGSQFGVRNNIFNSGSGNHYGAFNQLSGPGTGKQFGISSIIDNTGNGIHYGVKNSLSGTGTGSKYGTYNKIETTAGGTHYAVYGEAEKVGSYAGYFKGDVKITNNIVGKIKAEDSGDADMKAYIYGNITSSGNKRPAGSSDGYTISRTATGTYEVIFNTATADSYAYSAIASITYGNGLGFIRTRNSSATKLIIYTYDKNGNAADRYFTFVVYKK